MSVNQEVYKIYSICQGQYVMGMGGAVDLDINAVFKVMDIYGIPEDEQRTMFERVRKLARHMIKKHQDEAEAERQANKGQ